MSLMQFSRGAANLFKQWGKISYYGNHVRLSSTSNLIVNTDEKTGIATLQMNRKPVNSLSLELLTELCISLEKLEKSAKGIILTSAVPNVFCAGLDIMEIYQPKPERAREFWRMLQEVWLKLYGCQIPVIAAVNGHGPAGGCLLAVSCDYRIMAQGNYTIGLNETLLGIVAPPWFVATMKNTIGQRLSERAVQLGTLFTPDQALSIGLADEVVPLAQVLPRAKEEIKNWIKIPEGARALTKAMLRQETMQPLLNNREEDIDNFFRVVTSSTAQKTLGKYLESLQKQTKK